jgi:hypothetical protein
MVRTRFLLDEDQAPQSRRGAGPTASVDSMLARRYPGDRATGFRDGDLRGAISVRVPIPR